MNKNNCAATMQTRASDERASVTRRRFLQAALPAFATVSLLGSPIALAQSRRVDRIGLQLYSLREQMAADFEGTLAAVAEIGFKEMEFAGYYGRSANEVRRILDTNGLTSPAAHIPLNLLEQEPEQQIEIAATLGQDYIVLPFLGPYQRSRDNFLRVAELLNRVGELAAKADVRMGYHNHSFEFETLGGGEPGMDILLRETDPELVFFEIDLYWAANIGVDPKAYFRAHPGRFPMLHVKDRTASGSMADVGRGNIDFAEIFDLAEIGGFKHYFIEHDNPDDGINSIAYSYRTVEAIRF